MAYYLNLIPALFVGLSSRFASLVCLITGVGGVILSLKNLWK